jgi:hypothetical protein
MILKSLNTSLIDLLPTDINRIAEVAAPFSSICSEDQAIEVAEMGQIEVAFMPFRESKGILMVIEDEYKMTINSFLPGHEHRHKPSFMKSAILYCIGIIGFVARFFAINIWSIRSRKKPISLPGCWSQKT